MTIAIIDKYPIICSGLRLFIKNHFDDAAFLDSKSIEDFHSEYPGEFPEIIVMALSQDTRVDNLEIIKTAKAWYDLKTVIFYDEQTYPSMISRYFKAGARYYLSKTSNLNELIDCISNALEGKQYIGREALKLEQSYPLLAMPDTMNILLTTKEYEIAKYLSEGRKTSWIAEKLGRKTSTISTTKARVFRKLSIENIIQLRDMID